jgi:3-deoxy-manno-octulosonate cytidylyltransferase (CMP-KDO synthetase)
MKIFGIIPARYDSSRFPGKPLIMIHGKPMIQRVYEQASHCKSLSGLVVATDDDRIRQCVNTFGGNCCMTSHNHKSGTERCNEATGFFGNISSDDIIINIQGDEPFIDPRQLDQLIECFTNKEVRIGTLIKKIVSGDELFDPNVVKVLIDNNRKAIYFSRQALPYLQGKEMHTWLESRQYYKHVGIYGYSAGVLKELVKLPESNLEKAESLEQLRWIENGYSLFVRETEYENVAIDSPADLLKITNNT